MDMKYILFYSIQDWWPHKPTFLLKESKVGGKNWEEKNQNNLKLACDIFLLDTTHYLSLSDSYFYSSLCLVGKVLFSGI
jgi:hypothetical protein